MASLQQLRARFDGRVIGDDTFSARLAVGIRDNPEPSKTTWHVLSVQDGSVTVITSDGIELESTESVSLTLEVQVAVAASEETWDSIAEGGRAGLVEAAKQQALFVSGDASFFIRFMVAISDVWSLS